MFHGSMVALATPMHDDGGLDFEALERLVEFHIESGTDAIVSVGTTGESPTLNEKDHCVVIRKTVDIAAGRLPVIAGTGSNCTREAIDLTRAAMESGADACLLVTPYYNKPTQEGLYRHYKALAETVAIPQILYNVPSRTACDLLPETVERLSKIPNIIGIKEATGDLQRVQEIFDVCGDSLDIYGGDDASCRELMLMGGKGVISVTSNIAPSAMREMCAAAIAGNAEAAEKLDRPLAGLHELLFLEANPIPVKWALAEMGLMGYGIRLPLTKLSESYHETLRQAMRKAGVI